MVTSYVKIYGPPVLKAIRALEAVAVDLSKATGLKFNHRCLPYPDRMQSNVRDFEQYLKNMERTYVDCYEPIKLISDSQQMLGEYDFLFEWTEKPTMAKLETLVEKIDEAFKDLGCHYTIVTR